MKSQTLSGPGCHLWPGSAIHVLLVQGCAQDLMGAGVATAVIVLSQSPCGTSLSGPVTGIMSPEPATFLMCRTRFHSPQRCTCLSSLNSVICASLLLPGAEGPSNLAPFPGLCPCRAPTFLLPQSLLARDPVGGGRLCGPSTHLTIGKGGRRLWGQPPWLQSLLWALGKVVPPL